MKKSIGLPSARKNKVDEIILNLINKNLNLHYL